MICLCTYLIKAEAQELNAEVTIMTDQIQSDKTVFEILEQELFEFINNRKWTSHVFDIEERIDCVFLISITKRQGDRFSATLQVQSRRPVYNTSYNTPVFSVSDKEFEFTYTQNQRLEFYPDQHRSNLTAVLVYYIYIVLGHDYDTFSPQGGTEFYNKAQNIVSNAQNAASPGWKAADGNRNRYWIVDNILHQSFKPLRECLYKYHRLGLDKMHDEPNDARKAILESLMQLRKVHRLKPLSYNLQLFFFSKKDEITNIFKDAPAPEKNKVLELLREIDPANMKKYEKMK